MEPSQLLAQATQYAKQGDKRSARDTLRELLREEPENLQALFLFARVAQKREHAVRIYQKILEIDPDNQHALDDLEKLSDAYLSVIIEQKLGFKLSQTEIYIIIGSLLGVAGTFLNWKITRWHGATATDILDTRIGISIFPGIVLFLACIINLIILYVRRLQVKPVTLGTISIISSAVLFITYVWGNIMAPGMFDWIREIREIIEFFKIFAYFGGYLPEPGVIDAGSLTVFDSLLGYQSVSLGDGFYLSITGMSWVAMAGATKNTGRRGCLITIAQMIVYQILIFAASFVVSMIIDMV